ncbi:MAG: sulfotransferase [Fidelibacterota bacterium]
MLKVTGNRHHPMNEDSPIFPLMNRIWYLYKRNNWMVDPSRFFTSHNDVAIDRPIFLLGNQGGGLTLVSRMLRRNRSAVSATGNHRYWAGADELQNVMGPLLPAELSGIKYKAPPHPVQAPPRSWSYACDELIDAYRKTDADYTPELESKFRQILRYVIGRFGLENRVRFVDKSQVFTVRLSFIHRLLQDCRPKFVLITRNPYVQCPRAASGKAGDMKKYQAFLSWNERLTLCAQHWANSMGALLEDRERLAIEVLILKFEEILDSPEENLRRLCEFVELEFTNDMIPQPHHVMPLGTQRRDRWYPLRRGVNERYRDLVTDEDIEIVQKLCGRRAGELGYRFPF